MPPKSKISESKKRKGAARLIALRKALNLTQREMAERLEVTHGAIGLWERGERAIPGLVLKLISANEEKLGLKKKNLPARKTLGYGWHDPSGVSSSSVTSEEDLIPSPLATGSSGTFFEQHVNATWLSLLLVGAAPPLWIDTHVKRVSFQTRRIGWATDDFLVGCETGDGGTRRLAGQVKRSFTVSSSDEECRKTFLAFWSDFRSSQFDRKTDRLCLVVLRGTNVLLESLASLFDSASVSRTVEEFKQRTSKKGLLNSTAKTYAEEIRKILQENGGSVPEEDFWQFLSSLVVISFDLNTSTSQTEAWIRPLLAHSATGPDKKGAAKATWEGLLRVVSSAMPTAQEFSWADLPEELRKRHTPISASDHSALSALRDHSATITRGIRDSIDATIRLPRSATIAIALEHVEANRIVVLAGPAGHGKSAIGKNIMEMVRERYFTFSFRAEEFEKAHVDETLNAAGFRMSGEQLSALLAGQGKKFLLIDSVERLLEASVRESFFDLLHLVERDETWRVIITCRSYSIDLVVASFLSQIKVPYSVINVPELSDDELDEVQQSLPKLSFPLGNSKLRRLLKNPYVLDKAARMSWSEDKRLPENEREFRRLFWGEIVREDGSAKEAFPQRREKALAEIALRRAKAMSLYAKCDDLDQQAIQKLHQQDLIVYSEGTKTLAAPAHDVLEDWTLLNWVESQFLQSERNPKLIAECIGGFPAIRRAYRLWLSETSDLDPKNTDEYVQSVLKDGGLTAHFRDDTVIAVLKSDAGKEFLSRNGSTLGANGSAQLKRVVHLLRVACKSMPTWLATIEYVQSAMMAPVGTAWPSALLQVRARLSDFLPKERDLLLGMIEDWCNLLSIGNSNPPGYEDAAKIAFALLNKSGGYRAGDTRKRIYAVIAKIPGGARDEFLQLMERAESGEEREDEEFADFLLEGFQSSYVAKEFPDELIRLTKKRIYLPETEEKDPWGRFARLEIDSFFGLQEHRHYFPPSAIRGPFSPLLTWHFKKGIEFIIELANHSGQHYANPTTQDRLEPPWEVEVKLSDGTSIKQWHNPRLWQLYRGTSVGPYVLMCALMALEQSLLNIGESGGKYLDAWLLYLIRKSNNSSISAVVASIVAAYPTRCPEAAMSLLSCRDYIEIDQNMAILAQGISHTQGLLPSINVESEIYEAERKRADSLPHRRKHLGTAAFELQTVKHRQAIQAIIDSHRKALPKESQQTETDRRWRLTLFRMDIRNFTPRVATKRELGQLTGKAGQPGYESDEPAGLILEPKSLEGDLAEMIERNRPEIDSAQLLIGLQNWGWSVFSSEGNADPTKWQERLETAISATATGTIKADEPSPFESAPILIAAVCARDHWGELTERQKEWCLQAICAAIKRERDNPSDLVQVSRHAMSADRPSARAVSAIISAERSGKYRDRAISALVDALFHASDEVTLYASAGIGQYLWAQDSELAIKCVQSLIACAKELDQALELQREQRYDTRENLYNLRVQILSKIRERWKGGSSFDSEDIEAIDFDLPFAGEALKRLLHVFGSVNNVEAVKFFRKVIEQICTWWEADRKENQVPWETMHACIDKVSKFVLTLQEQEAVELCGLFLERVASNPKEVADFFKALVSAEDQSHLRKATFWKLWDEFALRIGQAGWVSDLDDEYKSRGIEMLRAIFLGLHWKRGVKQWKPHEDYEDRVVSLFERLPATSALFDQMAIYLFYVGDMTLPGAFVALANKTNGTPQLLSGKNTIFCLEQTLQKHVYGSPQKLKANPEIRSAVINLLDALVEKGSSAAFKMRDDFVTPMKG